MRVFYHIKSTAAQGETSQFISVPISQYQLSAQTVTTGFVPAFVPGMVTVDVCECPYQADLDADGFNTAIDLAAVIDILFAGQTDPQDANCPTTRGDFDCDGYTTVVDLSDVVDLLYASAAPPCIPCPL